MKQELITIETYGKGLYEISEKIEKVIKNYEVKVGLLNIFIQHTSASLIIQENADPSAKEDLEEFIERLIPENQNWHKHIFEGPDDTCSHMKSSLTQTSLNIPITNSRLNMGTWQGIYLWEHRKSSHIRKLLLTLIY